MLGANGIVGGGMPIACGAALAAQLEGGGGVAACFFGGHAFLQVVLYRNLQMGGDLHVEFPIYLRVRKRGTQTLKHQFHPVHLCSPFIASTRPITSERRCQYAASSASCLRPFLVIE